jgi:hypothetical protein
MFELVGAFHKAIGSRDSSVNTGLDDRAFIYRFPAATTDFSVLCSGVHPALCSVDACGPSKG